MTRKRKKIGSSDVCGVRWSEQVIGPNKNWLKTASNDSLLKLKPKKKKEEEENRPNKTWRTDGLKLKPATGTRRRRRKQRQKHCYEEEEENENVYLSGSFEVKTQCFVSRSSTGYGKKNKHCRPSAVTRLHSLPYSFAFRLSLVL